MTRIGQHCVKSYDFLLKAKFEDETRIEELEIQYIAHSFECNCACNVCFHSCGPPTVSCFNQFSFSIFTRNLCVLCVQVMLNLAFSVSLHEFFACFGALWYGYVRSGEML